MNYSLLQNTQGYASKYCRTKLPAQLLEQIVSRRVPSTNSCDRLFSQEEFALYESCIVEMCGQYRQCILDGKSFLCKWCVQKGMDEKSAFGEFDKQFSRKLRDVFLREVVTLNGLIDNLCMCRDWCVKNIKALKSCLRAPTMTRSLWGPVSESFIPQVNWILNWHISVIGDTYDSHIRLLKK